MSIGTVVRIGMGNNTGSRKVYVKLKNKTVWVRDSTVKSREELDSLVQSIKSNKGSLKLKGWTRRKLADGTVIPPVQA